MADLPKIISSATAKHVAALFYGNPVDIMLEGSADHIENQGTMTFVSYKGACFGITNGHVVENYGGPSKDRAYYLALNKHEPLPGRLLFKSSKKNPDFPFDIAVFLMHRDTIVKGGKIPIELDKCYSKLIEGEMGLAVGFPGIERRIKNKLQMEHPLYHVVAKCNGSSERQIVLYEKLNTRWERIMKFGGMSGGPIFRIMAEDRYEFSGILFEGRGFNDRKDGMLGDDVWICGFPLGPDELDKAFDVFNPSLSL